MNTLSWLLTLALVLWLLLGEPLLGRASHRRMLAALDRGDPNARLRFYRSWTAQGWLLAAVTLAICLVNGWSWPQLGLTAPHALGDMATGILAGVMLGLLLGPLLGVLLARRKRQRHIKPRTLPVAGGDKVLRMLPQGRRERLAFALLAITAGLTEELIWRGFGTILLQTLWPHWPQLLTIGVLAVAFGWAHLYQGGLGMLFTGLLGGLLAALYLASGSLWLPMLLHVLIDLRALLIPIPAEHLPAQAASKA